MRARGWLASPLAAAAVALAFAGPSCSSSGSTLSMAEAGDDASSSSGGSGGSASGGTVSDGGSSASSPGGPLGMADGAVGGGVGTANSYFLTVINLTSVCPGTDCQCLPQALPVDPAGQALCRIFFELAAGDSCAAHGLPAASADNVASITSSNALAGGPAPPGAVCALPQLPTEPVNGSCTTSSASGWCYVTGPGPAAGTCPETIATSPTGKPPTGAAALLGCGQTASSTGVSQTSASLIGTACTPPEEDSPSFAGFDYRQVTLDEGNAACGGGLCLVNHFGGLTTCPYGQDNQGNPPPGASACALPDGGGLVHPDGGAFGQLVEAWCTDRMPASTVDCSCRCQNALGRTDDGASYCTCPSGQTCTQVVPAIEPGDPRAGGYCIKNGTAYDPNTVCTNACNPGLAPCP